MKERKFTISFVNIHCSGIGEQLRSMVHYSPFVNNVADVIVWYDEQLRSMVHNSPFVNNVADVIVDVGKC